MSGSGKKEWTAMHTTRTTKKTKAEQVEEKMATKVQRLVEIKKLMISGYDILCNLFSENEGVCAK